MKTNPQNAPEGVEAAVIQEREKPLTIMVEMPIGKMCQPHVMAGMRKDLGYGFRYGKLIDGVDSLIEGHFVDADAVYHLWEWKNNLQAEVDRLNKILYPPKDSL